MNAVLLVTPGALAGLGIWLIVSAFRPQHPRLADAMASLSDGHRHTSHEPEASAAEVSRVERLGSWWIARRSVIASPTLQRRLHLRGRTVARHYAHKLLGATAGFGLPLAFGLVGWAWRLEVSALPAIASLAGALVGFVLPDLLLRRAASTVASDATESLLTLFDLVTLERLANRSTTQALHAAAELSDVPIFATVRSGLERARLQQRMPFTELAEVGRSLELPALVDLAEVMRIDESGASLAGPLRARVRELRDAHLTAEKVAASAISERMTLFMVVPSIMLGLFFLVPPMLRLLWA